MYENEAVQDLFKSMARVADYFNWDLSRREDPDDYIVPSAEVMLHEMEQDSLAAETADKASRWGFWHRYPS